MPLFQGFWNMFPCDKLKIICKTLHFASLKFPVVVMKDPVNSGSVSVSGVSPTLELPAYSWPVTFKISTYKPIF